ncbi:outer membrane protein assembly factor BamB family protein [Mucilaginibacter limnophilus]|nr:PQQ-binding-like beta-propeller repeat protein [Mucilaginibacter limnophilus]
MMKKPILLLTLALACSQLPASAQFGALKNKLSNLTGGGGAGKKTGSFQTVWEAKFVNKASRLAVSNETGSLILGTDDNSATVLDADGKPVWNGDYKKLTTNNTNTSEFQYIIRSKSGGYLFLFDSRKFSTDRLAVLDLATGKELWNSEEYQNLLNKEQEAADIETVRYIDELDAFLIAQKGGLTMVKASDGKKVWHTDTFKGSVGKYIYNKASNQILMVNYKPTALAALFSGFKNQLVKINALNGQILWNTEFRGTIEKKLITREPVIDLTLVGDKLFLWLDGLQAYDVNNGKKLWDVAYENDMSKSSSGLSGRGRKGIYGTLADPIYTDDAVYFPVLGSGNKSKYVEKHDLNSGKLLWISEKITGAFSMPHLYMTGGKIMVQIGGKVQVQEITTRRTADGSETDYKIYTDYVNQKNSLLALDANSGQTAWRSEKFDKRITDMIIHENKTVFAGDGDEFYAYDIASGKQLFDVKHDDAKVGKATDVVDFGDNVVVISEKGLASYKKADGSRNYATAKLSDIDFFYNVGGNFFLRSQKGSKNIIYGVDMSNGNIKGSVTSKGKGGSPAYGNGIDITDDGEYIFAFKGKKVEKIKVNN